MKIWYCHINHFIYIIKSATIIIEIKLNCLQNLKYFKNE